MLEALDDIAHRAFDQIGRVTVEERGRIGEGQELESSDERGPGPRLRCRVLDDGSREMTMTHLFIR
jgi:hypothetical protein